MAGASGGGVATGAASGAAMGASVGGPWGAAIGAVVGAASALFTGGQAAKAENKAAVARNQAIMEYNKKVMLSTAQSVSQINLQRSIENQKTASALFNINAQKNAAANQTRAMAAATDTVGVSARDAAQSVMVNADRAQGTVENQHVITNEGFNMMLRKTTDEGSNALQGGVASSGEQIMNAAYGQAAGIMVGAAANYGFSQLTPETQTQPKEVPSAGKNDADYDWWGRSAFNQIDLNFSYSDTPITTSW
ncbi:internal virion protein [Vibrio phage VPy02]|nr:internal virion protein [Vibrio phage VPy02]